MCLAIPAKIIKKYKDNAIVEVQGIRREANLTLCPEAKVGDYVIVHAGFAIRVLDPKDAQETLEIFKNLEELNNG
jgi:hydrogenase expression/formation protein HypC